MLRPGDADQVLSSARAAFPTICPAVRGLGFSHVNGRPRDDRGANANRAHRYRPAGSALAENARAGDHLAFVLPGQSLAAVGARGGSRLGRRSLGLRHVFCTTTLFTWKLDHADVSRMAGHANYRITLDMYVGSTSGILDRARAATE
jgi:hypothetical protein